MKPFARLLWLILYLVGWCCALVSAIFAALADDADAVMCWLENGP